MKRIALYIISLTLTASAFGQNKLFESTVAEILANNPTLAARRASTTADIAGMMAENNLVNPELEFEHQWGQPGVGNKWSISVVQGFDWPGVYQSRAKAAESGAKAAELLYRAELTDMRLRVSQTLADYIAARQQLELTQTVSENLSVIAEKISSAFNHGEATILDYRKICFEKIEAEAATDAAAALTQSLCQELIELNGGKAINLDEIIEFPEFQLKDEDYYFQQQIANDPSVAAGQYLTESALYNVKTASRNNMPGFSVGYIHNVEIGDHFNGVKVGITLPFFANRHRKAEAASRLDAAQNEQFEAELAVSRRVITDHLKAKNLNTRIAQYSSLFPAGGDDYLDLLRKSFDGGQMSLVIYLYEVNYYLEARSEYINLLHNRMITLLSLNRTAQ